MNKHIESVSFPIGGYNRPKHAGLLNHEGMELWTAFAIVGMSFLVHYTFKKEKNKKQ